jgi:hypothetical protein
LAIVFGGCLGKDIAGVGCPGISLTVVDSVSGNPVNSAIVTSTLYGDSTGSQTLVDTLRSAANQPVYIGNPLGTYDVQVSSAGYYNWGRNIVVTQDAGESCIGVTQKVVARLTRFP